MLEDPNNVVVDDTFTYVQIHQADAGCPTWPARVTFYKNPSGGNLWTGTPMMVVDGFYHQEGTYTNYQTEYNWVLGAYNSRRNTPTDVSVSVTAVPLSGSTYTIHAQVCLQPGGVAKTVRVYIVQLLDHWPTSCSYCRNCFMQAATTQDVLLTAGQCAVVTRTLTFNADSWNHQGDIRIVAWAQAPVNYGPPGLTTQIYNARSLAWPFPPDCNANGAADPNDIAGGTSEDCNANSVPDECDIAGGASQDCNANDVPDECDIAGGASQDCNANDVPDECDIAGGFSQDANGNGIPDECEALKGDLNCDGTVDFGDINPFILALSNPLEYPNVYPNCDIMNADINNDGAADFQDINPFIALLIP
jgi:hypothetical protein